MPINTFEWQLAFLLSSSYLHSDLSPRANSLSSLSFCNSLSSIASESSSSFGSSLSSSSLSFDLACLASSFA
ncbi:hypothetical protein D3C72_1401160 [compost metagenome]